jgi:hypothetical protein
VSGELHASAALPSGLQPPVPTGEEAGWVPEPVWTLWNNLLEEFCLLYAIILIRKGWGDLYLYKINVILMKMVSMKLYGHSPDGSFCDDGHEPMSFTVIMVKGPNIAIERLSLLSGIHAHSRRMRE